MIVAMGSETRRCRAFALPVGSVTSSRGAGWGVADVLVRGPCDTT